MILDTNAVSSLFVGDPDLSEVLIEAQHHHLPVVVIGEYGYGLQGSRRRDHLQALLDTLIQQSIVLPIDQTTAAIYSQIRHELKRKGRPIPENDVWIAALARQHGQPIVSRDDHFDSVSGLERRAW